MGTELQEKVVILDRDLKLREAIVAEKKMEKVTVMEKVMKKEKIQMASQILVLSKLDLGLVLTEVLLRILLPQL